MTRRPLLPLHDQTAPLVCTIGDDEVAGRIELLERMRSNLARLERTPDGLLLHFPARDEIAADLRRFAVEEQRCCAFWGFAVLDDDGRLALRWDGPTSSSDLLDRLAAFFTGDEPLTLRAGLL